MYDFVFNYYGAVEYRIDGKLEQHQANIVVHNLSNDDIVVLDGYHSDTARYQVGAICHY